MHHTSAQLRNIVLNKGMIWMYSQYLVGISEIHE
jgi:hypothetical protein